MNKPIRKSEDDLGEHTYSSRACIADIVECVFYYVVASRVRDTLAIIIVMICAFDFVDLAVFEENIGFFAEQLFEDFRHLVRSVCALGVQVVN